MATEGYWKVNFKFSILRIPKVERNEVEVLAKKIRKTIKNGHISQE